MSQDNKRILVVEDEEDNRRIVRDLLTSVGYEIIEAVTGEDGVTAAATHLPDLILMDIQLPGLDGYEATRRIKANPALPFMPIILVTAKADSKDVVAGLEAGADEYLTKPVDQAALVARVKSMLRIKALHDTTQEQAARLEAQSIQLAEWNRTLEQRVLEQLAELERTRRLKRFFSPQLAELVVSSGGEKLLESHRREITVVFCDLRGFTAFSETAQPEEVMGVLREYHTALGTQIFRFDGTLERFAGDGLMVFFNDPLPCPDPEARAVRMTVAMRQQMNELTEKWGKRGHQLGFGVGIAQGYATLGMIGFESRVDYGAIGPVTNLASRLCDQAQNGQILISQRVYTAVEELVEVQPTGELALKGFRQPVPTFNVAGLRE